MFPSTPILVICGTRPEAIKLAPVVRSLRERGHRVVLVATGQHPGLGQQLLTETGLALDVDLGLHQPGNTPAQLLSAILAHLPEIIVAYRPMLVLVQGDTVSAFAGALAATYARVPVGHIEAGLRTYDRDEPFPEEMHRCAITPLANLHFAPTPRAVRALEMEMVNSESIFLTGNSGIDAMFATLNRIESDPLTLDTICDRFSFVAQAQAPLVMVTVHRRENIGPRLAAITSALARLAGFMEAEIILPLHPNPAVANQIRKRIGGLRGVHLLSAVDHGAMIWLMRHARLLLTDSGGLQEEAPALGLRTLVLRTVTERPEAVAAGASRLVPLCADAIVKAVRVELAAPKMAPVFPFGKGNAATLIVDGIESWLRRSHRRNAPHAANAPVTPLAADWRGDNLKVEM